MDLAILTMYFAYFFVGGVFGVIFERVLLNPFAWARIQNLRGKNVGVAMVFFRSKMHRAQVINMNDASFDLKETKKRYDIDSKQAERLFGIPCLCYTEDNPAPMRLSEYGKAGDSSPEDFQMHIRLAILQIIAQEVASWENFRKWVLWGLGGLGILLLVTLLAVWGQGGTINNGFTATFGECAKAANSTAELVRYVKGG